MDTHQGIVKSIISHVLGKRDINIEVVFSDNLYLDAIANCESLIYRDYLQRLSPEKIAHCNSLNGLYIIPKDICSNQIILVSNSQRVDGYSYFSTIAHETQHAINHTEFCIKYCNNNFDNIYTHRFNVSFQIWDEFSARRTGHQIYTTYTMQSVLGYTRDDVTLELKGRQLKARLDELDQLLLKKNSIDLYKNIVAILAMFDVWTSDYNIAIIGLNTWCTSLHQALLHYHTIEEVDFVKLDTELKALWNQRK